MGEFDGLAARRGSNGLRGVVPQAAGLGARALHSGHGDPAADPAARIDWLIAHRLEREAQIVERLGHGPATARDLAAAIYTDTPPARLPPPSATC